MNEGLGLERHEGEKWMTEVFGWTTPLKEQVKGCEPWPCSFALNHFLTFSSFFHLIQDIQIKNKI